MINEHVEELLLHCDNTLMIPADYCANVREDNNLLHALMLLSSVGHSEIPVLNNSKNIVGTINMPLVLKGIKTETEYLWDKLQDMSVKEVMDTNIGIVRYPIVLEDVLHQLVDHKYVAIIDQANIFLGIITRKEILTRMNFLAHQIDRYCDIEPKVELDDSVNESVAQALGISI